MQQQTIALSTGAIEIVGRAPPPVPASPPAPPDLLGCVIDGRYAVKRLLGRGGMGSVYEAEQIELKKLVALKVLNAAMGGTEEFQKRFEREARAASRLSHSGCVAVLDFSRISRLEPAAGHEALLGVAYLVMEHVKGELLLDRLERGPLPPREAVEVVRGLLTALGHAHGLDLVHRDVKPANIMLSRSSEGEPQTKLLDFGLAKSVGENAADIQQPLTAWGMVYGTPKYLSPEQAGAKLLDRRSDLYSVGIVLFEAVTGRPPFDQDDLAAIVRDHVFTAPPSPRALAPVISKELDAVILKALRKAPDERFQTAKEFLVALDACPEATVAPEVVPEVVRSRSTRAAALGARLRHLGGIARQRVLEAAAAARPHVEALLEGPRRKAMVGGLAALVVVGGALLWSRARGARPPAPIATAAAPAGTLAPSPSAVRHLELAAQYQQKLWCGDAIDELERALNDDATVRNDPAVVRIAIPCLRARTQSKTLRFLVERVGAGADGELKQALAGDLKPDVRQGVERALERLSASP